MFVVEIAQPYEAGRVLGVFSTLALAQAAADAGLDADDCYDDAFVYAVEVDRSGAEIIARRLDRGPWDGRDVV